MVWRNAEKLGKLLNTLYRFLREKIWEANTLVFGHWPRRHSRWCFIAFCSLFFISSQYFHCLLWFTCWDTLFTFFLVSSYSLTFSDLLLSTAWWFHMLGALAIVCRFFYSLILMGLLVWVSYRVKSFKLMWNYCLITEIFSLWFTHTRRRISDESAILVVFSVVIPCEDSVTCLKASNHPVSVPKLGQRFWTQLAHAWDCWRNLKALIDVWSACH